MSSSKRSTRFVPSAEAAELYRDVLFLVVHDLGGVSSALGLRAEALSAILPEADRLALEGLSEQIRDINRLLRLVHGSRSGELMSPTKEAPVRDWWRLVPRLLAAVLPRNIAIDHRLGSTNLTSSEANTIALLLMLAGRDLTSRGFRGPAQLLVEVEPRDASESGTVVRLSLDRADWPVDSNDRAVQRWFRYAQRIATPSGAHVEWWDERDDRVVWTCSIGGS